jgi:hypothetical protein
MNILWTAEIANSSWRAMIALISALSQVLISYFDQEPCDNPKTGVVTPSTFVVEGDWLESAAILSRNGTFSNG